MIRLIWNLSVRTRLLLRAWMPERRQMPVCGHDTNRDRLQQQPGTRLVATNAFACGASGLALPGRRRVQHRAVPLAWQALLTSARGGFVKSST